MKRCIFFLFLCLGLSFHVLGQQRYNKTNDTLSSGIKYPPKEGVLQLYQEESLDDLLERYKSVNVRKNGMDGYRIQIFFESGRKARENAYEAKAKFLSNFQEIPAYVDYQTPFFKVRIGDFRTKREAQILYKKLRRQFPDAYITPIETIHLPAID